MPFPGVGTYTFKRYMCISWKGALLRPSIRYAGFDLFIFRREGLLQTPLGRGATSLLALKRLIKFAYETLTV